MGLAPMKTQLYPSLAWLRTSLLRQPPPRPAFGKPLIANTALGVYAGSGE
jgi:hypothetical protein